MGRDKAQVVVQGRPMLERVITCLRSVSDDVFVVGDRAPYHQYGVRVHADIYPGQGPLGAIATALQFAVHEYVLVVGCDMPYLSADLLRGLIDEPHDYDALVPVLGDDGPGQFQTLHSVYAKRCLPAIEAQLAAADLKVANVLEQVNTRTLEEGWLRQYDPWLRSFLNVNTVEELEAL